MGKRAVFGGYHPPDKIECLRRLSSHRLGVNTVSRQNSMSAKDHASLSPISNLWRCSSLHFPTLGKAVGHHKSQWCISVVEGFSVDCWYLNRTEQLPLDKTFSPRNDQTWWPSTEPLFCYQAPEPLCSPHVLSTYLTCYSCARCYTIVKRAASISSMNLYFKDNNSAVKMCSRLKLYKEDFCPRLTLSG